VKAIIISLPFLLAIISGCHNEDNNNPSCHQLEEAFKVNDSAMKAFNNAITAKNKKEAQTQRAILKQTYDVLTSVKGTVMCTFSNGEDHEFKVDFFTSSRDKTLKETEEKIDTLS
jgi:hypothetical protein